MQRQHRQETVTIGVNTLTRYRRSGRFEREKKTGKNLTQVGLEPTKQATRYPGPSNTRTALQPTELSETMIQVTRKRSVSFSVSNPQHKGT